MAHQARVWEVTAAGGLQVLRPAKLDYESRLEEWIERDISIISDGLLIIGRQVQTAYGGQIDLLCLDRDGDVTIIELKRDKTPREITAQTLDYASWISSLSPDEIIEIADGYFRTRNQAFLEVFATKFATELPETLNQRHSMLVVGSYIDASTERIIGYLSLAYGVAINAATFQFLRSEAGPEFLARVFLLDPTSVEIDAKSPGASTGRKNLSREQLQIIADGAGVGTLYEHLVQKLEGKFAVAKPTKSSLSYGGRINGSENAIFSLLPSASSLEFGVRYQVYVPRLAAYFNLSRDAVVELLPPTREPWAYYPNAPEDMTGFAGYFSTDKQVDHFANGLPRRLTNS